MNNAHGGMGPPLSQLMGPFDRGTAGQNTRRNNALLKSNKKITSQKRREKVAGWIRFYQGRRPRSSKQKKFDPPKKLY
jgi:hypothetical protein